MKKAFDRAEHHGSQSCEEEQIPVEALREQGAEVVEWPKWKSAETVPDDAL
ncbi:hypothetical protein PO124_27585 [Bacillus licheniformis]|nr:hypothetical protein [Bacillus licheniformis]